MDGAAPIQWSFFEYGSGSIEWLPLDPRCPVFEVLLMYVLLIARDSWVLLIYVQVCFENKRKNDGSMIVCVIFFHSMELVSKCYCCREWYHHYEMVSFGHPLRTEIREQGQMAAIPVDAMKCCVECCRGSLVQTEKHQKTEWWGLLQPTIDKFGRCWDAWREGICSYHNGANDRIQ